MPLWLGFCMPLKPHIILLSRLFFPHLLLNCDALNLPPPALLPMHHPELSLHSLLLSYVLPLRFYLQSWFRDTCNFKTLESVPVFSTSQVDTQVWLASGPLQWEFPGCSQTQHANTELLCPTATPLFQSTSLPPFHLLVIGATHLVINTRHSSFKITSFRSSQALPHLHSVSHQMLLVLPLRSFTPSVLFSPAIGISLIASHLDRIIYPFNWSDSFFHFYSSTIYLFLQRLSNLGNKTKALILKCRLFRLWSCQLAALALHPRHLRKFLVTQAPRTLFRRFWFNWFGVGSMHQYF